jgi:intracellular septation protein
MSSRIKMALDFGPLLLFGAVYAASNLYAATAALIVAVLTAIVIEYAIVRKVSPMLLITAGFVLPFGGLTLWLSSDIFIKMKPTILYAIFAAVLAGGLTYDRIFLKLMLGSVFQLPNDAWRSLTRRYCVFFLVMAALNLIVWRNFSESTWVAFKVFGAFGLTLLFSLLQAPFISRHQIESDKSPPV